ncbi:hypothetical protein BEN49_02695 [Hymenobacter coccineus]|uniref:Uncharacterized protein n=1 Tax=Hymenobacter coccineus TaxID=1908235 RepID=A0A1G1SU04_9BACT|nr:hypothetical protein BEN49_02695 [Hymenobacter coccineus]
MFLWWGADLVQFYNDAYRPSLGHAGKHPAALGQRGADCWPKPHCPQNLVLLAAEPSGSQVSVWKRKGF